MVRKTLIELLRRQIYGGQPNSDAEITTGLVNKWLGVAIAAAAQKNYLDNQRLDGIAYVNNSFYTTYKNLTISQDEQYLWKIELPQLPVGIGESDGVSTVTVKDSDSSQISYPLVMMSMNQRSFHRGMTPIPNKILAYSEGKYIYAISTLILSGYTIQVTMVSGGLSSDMDGEVNVPEDYFPFMAEYIKGQLLFERSQPVDVPNGADTVKTV